MPIKQDAQKERDALKRLTERGVSVQNRQAEKDAAEALGREGLSAGQEDIYERVYKRRDPSFASQKDINYEAYGKRTPTYNKEFGLNRSQNQLDNAPKISALKRRAGERAESLRAGEDARIAEAFQDIKDPALKERLMRRNRELRTGARENNLGEVLQAFQLDKQENVDRYNRALKRAAGVEETRDTKDAIEMAELARQKELQEKMALAEYEAALKGGGGRGGGGRKGKKGKYEQVVNESGGYSFFDPDGNPVTAAEYALQKGKYPSQVLAGSQDLGDQKYMADSASQLKRMKSGDLSVEEFQQSLEENYPHIYGINAEPEQQTNPMFAGSDPYGINNAFSRTVNKKTPITRQKGSGGDEFGI